MSFRVRKIFSFFFCLLFHGCFSFYKTLNHQLSQERSQWIFWIPIALSLGIVLFWMKELWIFYTLISALGGGYILEKLFRDKHRSPLWNFSSLMVFFIAIGGFIFFWHSLNYAGQPLITGPITVSVQGSVESIEYPSSSQRLFQRFRLKLDDESQALLKTLNYKQDFQNTRKNNYFIQKIKNKDSGGYIHVTSRFYEELCPGDKIFITCELFEGKVSALPWQMGPWDNSFFEGEWARGFSIKPEILLTSDNSKKYFFQHLRCFITQGFHYYLPAPLSSVACGFFTGDKSGLPQDIREEFSQSGLSHLLAIAGLHLSIIMAFCFVVFRGFFSILPIPVSVSLWCKHFLVPLLLMGAAFMYLQISGGRIPVWRAFFMVGATQWANITNNQRHPLYILSLLAILFLCTTPEWVFNLSFQLSFVAVLALLSFYQRKRLSWRDAKKKDIFSGAKHNSKNLAMNKTIGLLTKNKKFLAFLFFILRYFSMFLGYISKYVPKDIFIFNKIFSYEKTILFLERLKYRWYRQFYNKSLMKKKSPWFYVLKFLRYFWRHGSSAFVASGLITISTAPLMAFHFHHVSFQGLFSNILAIAWTTLAIFPLGIVALVTLFIPLESIRILAFGLWAPTLRFLIDISSFFAKKAQWMLFPVVPFEPLYLLFLMGGIFWFFLWQNSWRWWGLIFSNCFFILILFFPKKPKIFIHSQIPLMAYYKKQNNTLFVSSLTKGKRILAQWKEFYPLCSIKKATVYGFLDFFIEESIGSNDIWRNIKKNIKNTHFFPQKFNEQMVLENILKVFHDDYCAQHVLPEKNSNAPSPSEKKPFSFLFFSEKNMCCHHDYVPF